MTNLELVRRLMRAVNAGDLDGFLALMDEDVESVSRIVAIEGGMRGHDGVRRWWDAWFEAFPDYKLEELGTEEVGNMVLAGFRAVGRAASSAVPYEDAAWHASQWRNGKCVWWQVFGTRAEAVEEMGRRAQAG